MLDFIKIVMYIYLGIIVLVVVISAIIFAITKIRHKYHNERLQRHIILIILGSFILFEVICIVCLILNFINEFVNYFF